MKYSRHVSLLLNNSPIHRLNIDLANTATKNYGVGYGRKMACRNLKSVSTPCYILPTQLVVLTCPLLITFGVWPLRRVVS